MTKVDEVKVEQVMDKLFLDPNLQFYVPLERLCQVRLKTVRSTLELINNQKADPDMPTQQLLLHFGELTENEILLVRAAIRFANQKAGF